MLKMRVLVSNGMTPPNLDFRAGGVQQGNQPRKSLLEDIAGRPLLELFDGELLPDHSRNDNDGHIGTFFPANIQSRHTAKRGERIVGKNQIRIELIELPEECLLGIDPACLKRDSRPL